MKKITLSDIAQKTGFSVNTVSHALKDKSDISKETKKYINDTAIAMGYIPNISAGVLRGGKTMSVAIILDDSAAPYYSEAIKEAERFLHRKGYSLLLMNTYGDEELERSAIIRALSQNVDGIILSPVQKTDANIDFLERSLLTVRLLLRVSLFLPLLLMVFLTSPLTTPTASLRAMALISPLQLSRTVLL